MEAGSSVEVDGWSAVCSDWGEGGGREDGAGCLMEGGAREVGTEQGGVSTAIQEEVCTAHVGWHLEREQRVAAYCVCVRA